MKILITGANGFVGKNLRTHLDELEDVEYKTFTRETQFDELPQLLDDIDCIIHLAGVNRTETEADFVEGNCNLTSRLLKAVTDAGRSIPVIYSSSIQAELDNAYGRSKRAAEEAVANYGAGNSVPVRIYRLANVFGKWCRPNYNSMVATFCHNICRDIPIQINDDKSKVQLVYIDDVCAELISMARVLVTEPNQIENTFAEVEPVYSTTVGEIAGLLDLFKASRENLISERVGDGFIRKLYATYVSYLPPARFSYTLPKYGDERGVFVEMLKTRDSGQFSFFTAHPGITRGGHYHHTKNEKFLVIKGKARFCFRHVVTDEFYELFTDGSCPEIVETAPGWSHDITNVGDDEMVVMLWANEIFDRQNPDTFTSPVLPEQVSKQK